MNKPYYITSEGPEQGTYVRVGAHTVRANEVIIPNLINKVTFELRESCRQTNDRKWHSINSIQCHLRSLVFDALTRSNVTLFMRFGIIEELRWQAKGLHFETMLHYQTSV